MKIRSLLSIASFLLGVVLCAQQSSPKVGLVLSGGSAHGLSHIGVLQYLEEHDIQVDYITGTSMGSIIGGLYATGMSAQEILDMASSQDWSALLRTQVHIRDIAPVEKDYHNRYALTLELTEDGLKLPQGFFNSQELDLTLNRMFRATNTITDFDSLPYPFRCIAVDIETGEIVVLKDGHLATAVRASMSIPSVFSPVVIDDRMLVDGGLIRNFPVEEVIEMGADVVIGVYVGSILEERENLISLIDILNQSAFMMGILDSREQKRAVDVLIEPDVKELPSFGFDLYDDLVREGYQAASKVDWSSILSLEQATRSPADRLRLPAAAVVSQTRLPYVEPPFDALAKFKYGYARTGSTTYDDIEAGVNRIFGTKHFDNVNYGFRNDARGRRILDLYARPRSVNTFSFAANYLPSSKTSVVVTNELRNKLSSPSVLYSTFRLSELYGAKLDYQYRLGDRKNFLFSAMVQAHRYEQELFNREELDAKFNETKIHGQVAIGYEPNNSVITRGYVGIQNHILDQVADGASSFSGYDRIDLNVGVDAAYSTIDVLQFPTTGISAKADISYDLMTKGIGAPRTDDVVLIPEDQNYLSAQFKGTAYYTPSAAFTLITRAAGGYKSSRSLVDNYRVGGLEGRDLGSVTMLGLTNHQLHFDQYVQIGSELRFSLWSSTYLSFRYDFLSGRRAFQTNRRSGDEVIDFGSFGTVVAVATPLGPIQFGYGRNSYTRTWHTNFTIGYTFF